jgi:hypothetical protein
VTVVDANNIIVADSRLDPLLSPVASKNQRGEIGSGISNARGISKAQSLEGKIGNRDGLGRAQCHTGHSLPDSWSPLSESCTPERSASGATRVGVSEALQPNDHGTKRAADAVWTQCLGPRP